MKNSIDISKLKRNSKILMETEDTVYEITVSAPKSCSVTVNGGIRFLRPTKAKINGSIKKGSSGKKTKLKDNHIEKGKSVQFSYKDKDSSNSVITSPVKSATVYAPDNSWHYDAIEKDKDENTDKA